MAANESLVAEISARGVRKTTNETRLDRKTIRAILNGKKVEASTLAKVVIGLRQECFRIACREPLFGLGVAHAPRGHSNEKESGEQREPHCCNAPEEKRGKQVCH